MANIAETADVFAANLTSNVASIISNTTNLLNNETFDFECPSISKLEAKALENTSLVIEGIAQVVVAIFGIIGNTIASFILGTRKDAYNTFDSLCISLTCFDSFYLIGCILQSLRHFKLETQLHVQLYPLLFYPFHHFSTTGSIFMTVAISLERYIAVHYPLQRIYLKDSRRTCKYIFSVIVLSLLFTIPKFFESETVTFIQEIASKNNTEKVNKTVTLIKPTDFRVSPGYVKYYNWSRLIFHGLLPFVLLVYLNGLMYQDIKSRRKDWEWRDSNARQTALTELDELHENGNRNVHDGGSEKRSQDRNFERKTSKTRRMINSLRSSGKTDVDIVDPLKDECQGPESSKQSLLTKRMASNRSLLLNNTRRKVEDKMAKLFMWIVVVFILCHLPRFILNIHELVTIEMAMMCIKIGMNGFPLWSLYTIKISHFMLALNSSINIFIYFFLSSRFRQDCKKWYKRMKDCFRGR